MLPNIALEEGERWRIVLSADKAVDAILDLLAKKYSLVVKQEGAGIEIVIKKKPKVSCNMDRETSEVLSLFLFNDGRDSRYRISKGSKRYDNQLG
ncbi:MAG: hypothetical protein QW776_05110 [Candidatus Nitrosocaldus sp.]